MKRFWAVPLLVGSLLLGAPALAANLPSPQQIQTMIATGQESQAVQTLQRVLQDHPQSGVAWYLLAEAYDAQNQEKAAANALNMAERYAPGLPFANAQKAAALRAHINGSPSAGIGGGHIAIFVIAGLVLLLLALRFLPGRGLAQRNYGYAAPPPPPGTPPYGYQPGPMGGPTGSPWGGGLGSAIMGGLAAGAGFAAGERIIDGMMGPPNNGGPIVDQNGFSQTPNLSQDDGLIGNPGWDDPGSQADDGLNGDGWS